MSDESQEVVKLPENGEVLKHNGPDGEVVEKVVYDYDENENFLGWHKEPVEDKE